MGTYVPQSVMTKDGKPLDIDIVLSEFISDGSELFVEYSKGPIAYKARCAVQVSACCKRHARTHASCAPFQAGNASIHFGSVIRHG